MLPGGRTDDGVRHYAGHHSDRGPDRHPPPEAGLPGEEIRRTFWATPAYVPVQPAEAIYHCTSCNKASDTPLEMDDLGDPSCATCRQLREGYRVCTQCRVFYPVQPQPFCPYSSRQDQHRTHWPRTPRLLQGDGAGDASQGHRVAYLLVAVNATYPAVREEAQALMARFRQDRFRFERPAGGGAEALRWTLARTRPTRDGLFEYLQAAQDLHRFQEDVQQDLAAALRETEAHQRDLGMRRLPPEQYRIEPEDYTPEALATAFLYRSPLLTLLVLPEAALPHLYRRLLPRLQDLQLAYRVRLVTCRHSHPVWMVLRHLGVSEGAEAFTDPLLAEVGAALQRAQLQLDAWKRHMLGTREAPLELVQRSLQRANDRHALAQAEPTQEAAHALELATDQDFIRRGEFLACDVLAVEQALGSYQARRGPLPPILQRVRDGLPLLRQAQAEAAGQAAQVLEVGARLQEQLTARRQRLAAGRLLTILRSGVERTFTGSLVDALLGELPSLEVTPSQVGNVAEMASRLLTEVAAMPAAARDRTFRSHLLLELDASTRERGPVLIPREVVARLRQWLLDPQLTPEATPGFLRELALQWLTRGAGRRRVPQRRR